MGSFPSKKDCSLQVARAGDGRRLSQITRESPSTPVHHLTNGLQGEQTWVAPSAIMSLGVLVRGQVTESKPELTPDTQRVLFSSRTVPLTYKERKMKFEREFSFDLLNFSEIHLSGAIFMLIILSLKALPSKTLYTKM